MAPWFLNLSLSLCSQHFVNSCIFHLSSQLLEAGPEKISSTCHIICPNNPIRTNSSPSLLSEIIFYFEKLSFLYEIHIFPCFLINWFCFVLLVIILLRWLIHLFFKSYFFLTMFVRSSQVLKQQKERGTWSLHVSYCCSERNKSFICLVLCGLDSLRTSLTYSECSITTVLRRLLSLFVGGNSSHMFQFLSLN